MNWLAKIGLAALCAAFVSSAAADVHEDMVELDRAYIPALAITNRPVSATTRRAMERLRATWDRFRARHPSAPKGYADREWSKADEAIEQSIATAEAHVRDAKPAAAHEALEGVREAQFELRRHAGVAYWMDDLTAFHSAMERVAGAAAGKNASTLSDADIAAIRAAMPEAEQTWSAVLARRQEGPRYGVARERDTELQKLLDAETKTLAELKSALDRGDRGEIAARASATKPAFSKLFQVFGNFEGLQG